MAVPEATRRPADASVQHEAHVRPPEAAPPEVDQLAESSRRARAAGAGAPPNDPLDSPLSSREPNGPLTQHLLLRQQRTLGNAVVQRLIESHAQARPGAPQGGLLSRVGDELHRQDADESDLDLLTEMLDRFNVPESEVIALIRGMTNGDKAAVAASATYRTDIADALDFDEMMQVVAELPLRLAQQLEWLNAASLATLAIGYDEIQALVTAAPAAERDALKTDAWKSFFVSVCTNETMVTALNDLGFDLATKLTWLRAEMTVTSVELSYATIQPWITAASQPDRDALKNAPWPSFFVEVCDDATMVTALNDLGFDLVTKLTWLRSEMTVTRFELDYATIQPWIVAAPQGERDLLKTPEWQQFFVEVCRNATMETALTDLGFALRDRLRWLIAEGSGYEVFKSTITAATAADKTAALADQPFLLELKDYFSWDEFAKCVELLGSTIPDGPALVADATVQAALTAAFAASGAAIVPAPPAAAPPGVHEEGGFIYLDIVTNTISTDSVAAGAQASLPLNDTNPPDNAITVGGYHTHPNVGPAWGAPFASGADVAWATRNGIPLLIRGAFPTVAATSDLSTGPARLHIAGDRGFPGTSGGEAPQATLDGEIDEL